MLEHREFEFSADLGAAVLALDTVGDGRGWANVSPVVSDDVPELRVTIFGLSVSEGVPVASYVTAAPRRGENRPSSLGLLHTRGRLGVARIRELIGDAPFVTKQDHSRRGLVLEVPWATPAPAVLRVMCSLTESLCDFPVSDRWSMTVTVRD